MANLPTPHNLAKLAKEIAMDIKPFDDILRLHELDNVTWNRIAENPQFQAMLRDMIVDWNSAKNGKERIRVKSAIGVELVLDTIITDCMDERLPLNQRVEAIKMLSRLGELEQPQQGQGGGADRVVFQIHIGSTPAVTIDATPVRQEVEDLSELPK